MGYITNDDGVNKCRIKIDERRDIEWWIYRHMSIIFCLKCRVKIGTYWQSRRPNEWKPQLCRCELHRQGDNPPKFDGWGYGGRGRRVGRRGGRGDDPSPH